jgi:hypothetical protein
MDNLFEHHTDWTDEPCYYVVAVDGCRRATLAGPYLTRGEADDVLPRAKRWAIRDSGDHQAARYRYHVAQHYNGHDRSILGETRA